jgi:hypothetical protein
VWSERWQVWRGEGVVKREPCTRHVDEHGLICHLFEFDFGDS